MAVTTHRDSTHVAAGEIERWLKERRPAGLQSERATTRATPNKENEMSDTTLTPAADTINREGRSALLARMDAEEAIARATKCDVPDCDGWMHEANAEPSEWYHRVYCRKTDSLEVEVTRHSDGHYYGWMAIDVIDDATANEMREYAAECTKQAAELLAAADRVDELNKVAA